MKIDIKPRKDHFYAIKDAGTGQYLKIQWETVNGQETCWYYNIEDKVSKVAGNEQRARSRFNAVINKMMHEFDAVMSDPPSHRKDDNLALLRRLMDGDLVLVRIEIDLNVREQPA